MEHRVFLSIGSNIGDGVKNCNEAISRLRAVSRISVREVSSFYKTAPVGCLDQEWFINCAAMLYTSLDSSEILSVLLATEREMGRKRVRRWGERLIDLDLLLYNEDVVDSEFLTLPHPRMHERAFVLVPLMELSPGLAHPLFNRTFSSLLSGVSGQEVFQVRDI